MPRLYSCCGSFFQPCSTRTCYRCCENHRTTRVPISRLRVCSEIVNSRCHKLKRYNFRCNDYAEGWRIKYYSFRSTTDLATDEGERKTAADDVAGATSTGNASSTAAAVTANTANANTADTADTTDVAGAAGVTSTPTNASDDAKTAPSTTATADDASTKSAAPEVAAKNPVLIPVTNASFIPGATANFIGGANGTAIKKQTNQLYLVVFADAAYATAATAAAATGLLREFSQLSKTITQNFNVDCTGKNLVFRYCNQCHDYNPWVGFCTNTSSCVRKLSKKKQRTARKPPSALGSGASKRAKFSRKSSPASNNASNMGLWPARGKEAPDQFEMLKEVVLLMRITSMLKHSQPDSDIAPETIAAARNAVEVAKSAAAATLTQNVPPASEDEKLIELSEHTTLDQQEQMNRLRSLCQVVNDGDQAAAGLDLAGLQADPAGPASLDPAGLDPAEAARIATATQSLLKSESGGEI